MSETFKAVQLTDRVYWVGAIDWGLRNFHGYLTSRGTSYNAFLIKDDDGAILLDTVKAPFFEQMWSRVTSVVEPSSIHTLISNHSEMDHSGGIPELLRRTELKRILASPKGVEALNAHFHWDAEVEAVKTGERRDIGGAGLRFVETRMLHWPDSMFTYLEGDKVLFSNDAFGMHLASSERYVDEIDPIVWRYEAAKYYANILLPFSPLVKKLIDGLPGLDLDIALVACDHGPLWRNGQHKEIVELYEKWATGRPGRKAVVVYDSMWGSTARMARAVGEGFIAADVPVKLMPLEGSHRSDVATELLDAGALVAGAPTMNNQMYPTMADMMTYIKGLKPRPLVGAAFGSYGWSGESVRHLQQMLVDMKVDTVGEGLAVQYAPDDAALKRCFDLGQTLAEKLGGTLLP